MSHRTHKIALSVAAGLVLASLSGGAVWAATSPTASLAAASTSTSTSSTSTSIRADVERAALSLSTKPDGTSLTDAESAAAQVTSVLTTYAVASAALGTGLDPSISPTEPVWAVTAHAPISNDAPSGVTPKQWNVYGGIYDATSGDLILLGTGVDFQALGLPASSQP